MKIIKNKNNRKIYVVFAVVILLAIGVGIYLWSQESTANETELHNDQTTQTQNETSDDSAEDPEQSYVENEDGTPVQYEGQTDFDGNANCIDAECSNFLIPEDE